MPTKIAIDAMGGDHGLSVTLPAALNCLARYPTLEIMLVGDTQSMSQALLNYHHVETARLHPCHASEVVAMDENPTSALKNKKDSSMRVALELVKAGQAQACVSAGNTGALMATARFVLKTIPGIERPAIAKMMPTLKGSSCVLDLGANVDCTAAQLFQFAVMGSSLASALNHLPAPSIGLLNIGSEAIKGNDTIKETAELLRNSPLNFYGNVEGDDIFKGTTDVVVSDGFSGNVALKTSEGVAKMLATFLRDAFERNLLTRLVGLLAKPVMRSFKKQIDPRSYNGASFLGLNGIVIKSHGGADSLAFENAIERAMEEAESGLLKRISESISASIAAQEAS